TIEPAQFAAMAERVSEDVATNTRGGSLGGINAFMLQTCPEVLDALSALKQGEVSRPVESAYGFHVFLLRAPPRDATVSGARIVVGYDEAPWLQAFLARRPLPRRSRAEALALAQKVYERARQGEDFQRLVEEFTDHQEAVRKGDFGAWSTRAQS